MAAYDESFHGLFCTFDRCLCLKHRWRLLKNMHGYARTYSAHFLAMLSEGAESPSMHSDSDMSLPLIQYWLYATESTH